VAIKNGGLIFNYGIYNFIMKYKNVGGISFKWNRSCSIWFFSSTIEWCWATWIIYLKKCYLCFNFQPKRLLSPTTVLKRQKGNCFEYSTVLCSLLIAAGYDAYSVSGYACRETCLMDEAREICPLLKKREQVLKYCYLAYHCRAVALNNILCRKFESGAMIPGGCCEICLSKMLNICSWPVYQQIHLPHIDILLTGP
jgi:hypothetical protein